MQRREHNIIIGESNYTFNSYFKTPNMPFLLRLHGDETDASSVGKEYVSRHGGFFLDVSHPTREVVFPYQNQQISFDPNRVFQNDGIEKTLFDYQSPITVDIVSEVKKFSGYIKQAIQDRSEVIVLHNNIDFNIHDYEEGGECAYSARDININPNQHPHNFVIVTLQADFRALKKKKYNVVLLSAHDQDHPGSLSAYCYKNNQRYFNIETKMGHSDIQMELLNLVCSCL